MTADEVLRAMEYHGFSVFGPPRSGVPKDKRWHARDEAGDRQGWGSTPTEAVQDAIKSTSKPTDEWDFLE